MSASAVVLGAGASCPLGRTARSVFAAVNAGIRRFVEIEGVLDAAGQPARGCRLVSLAVEDPLARATWFARDAIAEALRPLKNPPEAPIPVFLAAPAAAKGASLSVLVRALAAAVPDHRLHWGPASILTEGRAGGAAALDAALDAMRVAPLALVGGLDCWVAGEPLRYLVRDNRLLGRRNCDGRLPGEGAAFVLIGRPGAPPCAGLGLVHAVARARDPHPFDGDGVHQAVGLTQVFAALRPRWASRVDEVVAAQSNERTWGTELATAYLRNAELMPEPMRVRTLASALGDCGAAAFPLGLGWALDDFALRTQRPQPVRSALVYSSSDSGAVGGVILSACSASVPNRDSPGLIF